MTRKYRAVAGPIAIGYNNGAYAGQTQLPGSSEWIDSTNHNLKFLGVHDCGGPMLLSRDSYFFELAKAGAGQFKGSDLVISGGPGAANFSGEKSDSSMNTMGATAVSRTLPTVPSSEIITSGSEIIRDGIPSMIGWQTWKERTKVARNSGSEYLNVQFGWIPLVNDIRNFAKMVKNHSKILSDFQKGSGQITRAGYEFPSSTISDSWTGNCLVYRGGNNGISTSSPATYVSIQETRTWFKGAFKYHLPASGGQLAKAQLYAEYADKLLGVKPTPSNIWNASPWTWAFDWFANAGDVMTNISQLGHGGTVLFYGYMMSSSKTDERIIAAAGSSFGRTAGSRRRLREFKKRLPAHPYGFGVLGSSLTNAQKAVLVALGLSHGGHG